MKTKQVEVQPVFRDEPAEENLRAEETSSVENAAATLGFEIGRKTQNPDQNETMCNQSSQEQSYHNSKTKENSRTNSIGVCKKMKKKPKMVLETQLMRHSSTAIRNFKPVRESTKNEDSNSRSTSARFYQ